MENTHPTFGNGKICYLEIPAINIDVAANFYKEVFGWHIRHRSDGKLAFDDIVNEVSGTWRTDRTPAITVTILTYIMVDDIYKTITAINLHGGIIVQPVGIDLPEITARFSDPAGNIFGLFQQ